MSIFWFIILFAIFLSILLFSDSNYNINNFEKTDKEIDIIKQKNMYILRFETVMLTQDHIKLLEIKFLDLFKEEISPKLIIIDFRKVEFFCDVFLGPLVKIKRITDKTPEEVSLRLVVTNNNILQIFKITKLHMVFSIFENVEEAILTNLK